MTPPTDHLRWGWQPFRVWSVVEWCGHRVEGVPVPTEDGRWRLIPILGEGEVMRGPLRQRKLLAVSESFGRVKAGVVLHVQGT